MITHHVTTNRVQVLEGRIREARVAYYSVVPVVDDETYDSWCDELRTLAPASAELKAVGAPPVSNWSKVRHDFVMGSLNKVQTPEELKRWSDGIRNHGPWVVVSKLDGISVSLRYEEGVLVQALTRGDGTVGEDITANVCRMKVPRRISNPSLSQLTVRGEIVLFKSDHAKHFATTSNPRNTASGTAKRYDGQGCEHLNVLVYEVVDGHETAMFSRQFEFLTSLGFNVPEWYSCYALDEVTSFWEKYHDRRLVLDYEIDGLVVRYDDVDLHRQLGDLHGRPRAAVAFKFRPQSRETVLLDVKWQVGGTGRLTPVAVFEPVQLVGVTIVNASLYSAGFLRASGLQIGDKILVSRANDVIPKIHKVV
jgi:DNA ligase (NAD+)